MRNLKRALSLALASVMLMGMMVVGSSAASFPDVEDTDHVEAIEVLSAVGVIVGDNGNFRPDDKVSRNEMAVIMAKLILGTYEADSYVGSHPFNDVPDWASRYVAACYNSGIIAGRSATTYDGASTVTAVEAAAMMLRALGYEDLSLGAAQWDQPVAAKANEINLFKSLSGSSQTPMDRNSVAQLALNTLEATMVTTRRSGMDITLPDGTTIVGTRNYDDRYAIDSIDYDGDRTDTLQLCEYLYRADLVKNTSEEDDFGRPATIWEYKGKDVISLAKDATLTYTKEVKAKDIYKALGLSGSKTATHVVNGDEQGSPATLNSTATETLGSGNGTLTQVYKDGNSITITVIDTFLAQVSGDYNEEDEQLDITMISDASALTGLETTLKLENFANLADFSDEDYVLVTAVTDGVDSTIKTIVPAEVVTATVTGYTQDKDDNAKDVTFDGKTYEYNINFDANSQSTTYAIKEESVFIMDNYGYVIGLDEVANSDDYVFILEFKSDGWNTSKSVSANAYFTDGTNKDIKLEKVNGKSIDTVNSGDPGATKVTVGRDTFYAGWYTYTEKNGAYRVTGNNTSVPTVVTSPAKVTENGKPTITLGGGTAKGSDKTILVMKDGNDVKVYTGVKEMPTITAGAATSTTYAWTAGSSYASHVFVDVGNGSVKDASSASGDLIFIIDKESYKVKMDEDENTYYLYDKAIVNGKSQSVKAASKFADNGLYHSVRYDENDFVDAADLALDADADYIVKALTKAAVKGEGRTVNIGALADMRLADEFVIRVVTSDKKVVTIKDAEALNARYKGKVVNGNLYAAQKDDEVTTLILVVTGVENPPSGGGSQGTKAKAEVNVTFKKSNSDVVTNPAWEANDTVQFTATGLSATATYNVTRAAGNWTVAVATPAKWTGEFDGAKLTLTAPEAGELGANPISGAVTVTMSCSDASVASGDATIGTFNDGTDAEGSEPEQPGVTSVTISPKTATVAPGESQEFTATVVVTGGAAQTVTWKVEGGVAETTITNGTLNVAASETAETLTVTATSTVDNKKMDTATVTVSAEKPAEHVHNLTWSQVTEKPATCTEAGEAAHYTVTCDGKEGKCDLVAGAWYENNNGGSKTEAGTAMTDAEKVIKATGHTAIETPGTTPGNYAHQWSSTNSVMQHAVKCQNCTEPAVADSWEDCDAGSDGDEVCNTCGQTGIATEPQGT